MTTEARPGIARRAAPEIVTLYAANLPATAIRAKVRQQFDKNRFVDDLEAVDVLLLKGYQEYQETVNAWKMDSHLMQMFNKEEVRCLVQNIQCMTCELTYYLYYCRRFLFQARPHCNDIR